MVSVAVTFMMVLSFYERLLRAGAPLADALRSGLNVDDFVAILIHPYGPLVGSVALDNVTLVQYGERKT